MALRKFFQIIALNFFGLLVVLPTVMAQVTSNEVSVLHFGTFIVKQNSTVSNLTVSRTGVVTAGSAFIILSPPNRGTWFISGLPPSTTMNFSFTPATLSGPGGQTFTVSSFTPLTPLNTNPAGETAAIFGATLSTSGSGTPYTDGSYTGSYDLIITY